MAPSMLQRLALPLVLSLSLAPIAGGCAPRVEPAASDAASAPAAPPSPAAAPASPTTPDTTPASRPSAAPTAVRTYPASAAECKAMLGTEAAARTDAKVTTDPGAGKSDRFQAIVSAIKSQRGAFRCCYELWAKDNPRKDARVTLGFVLDETGMATEVHLKRPTSDRLSEDAEGCIVDVAMALSYPRSPSDRVTSFEYELGFKHHKAPEPAPAAAP